MSLSPIVSEVLREVRGRVEREFPGRLQRLVVFGSTARGEATEDSDVDVLIILDTLTFAERSRVIDIAAETGFARDLVLAPLVQTVDEWQTLIRRERGLPGEVDRDGVEV